MVSESDWQKIVIKIAVRNDWKWYHPPNNLPNKYGNIQNIVAGYPDLTLVKDKRLLFVELKTDKGRVSKEQKEWQEVLKKAGCECYIWRPKDLIEVQKILR